MNALTIIQTVLGALLVVLVLIQNRGAGLGATWGGGGGSYTTRRGLEKILFRLTILVASLFIILSFAGFLV